jgi:glycine/D-amino acid oxidase-like deaminating enzyme
LGKDARGRLHTQKLTLPRAGVIGLSCAILLQEAGYAVTIVARDFPAPFETMDPLTKINYTSPWGGARMYTAFTLY